MANARAVELAVRAARAFGATIHSRAGWARKHYFYPDLPRNYQITQQREPLVRGGRIPYEYDGRDRALEVIREHRDQLNLAVREQLIHALLQGCDQLVHLALLVGVRRLLRRSLLYRCRRCKPDGIGCSDILIHQDTCQRNHQQYKQTCNLVFCSTGK